MSSGCSHSAGREIPHLFWNYKVHCHWNLFWARWTQSTLSHPVFPRSILILSYRLRLGIPNGSSLQIFNQNYLYISHLSNAYCMLRLAYPPWFDHPSNISLTVKFVKFLVQSSPLSRYFLPLESKHSPQQLVLKLPQLSIP